MPKPDSGSRETAALTPPSSIPPGTTRFGIEIGSVGRQEEISRCGAASSDQQAHADRS